MCSEPNQAVCNHLKISKKKKKEKQNNSFMKKFLNKIMDPILKSIPLKTGSSKNGNI